MLRSLRFRLLASFWLVIALSLILSAFASVWLLRDQQRSAAEERVVRLVEPLASYVQVLELSGWPKQAIQQELSAQAQRYDIRVMLLDRTQRIVFDTSSIDSMIGEVLELSDASPVSFGDRDTQLGTVRYAHHDSGLYLFTADATVPAPTVGRLLPSPELSLVIAVPAADVNDAWARLLPRIFFAGGLAAIFALIVSTVISGRITRPIVQMTRASEAMAHGDYEQQIEVSGDSEVANLARAFNQMSQQVNRSNRAMRQLLADVSHELKTPLTSIQGFSQAMVEGIDRDPDEARQVAGIVYEEAARMRVLVDDLLELSSIEAGEFRLELGRVDVDAAARATERRLHHKAEAADVRVRLQLAGGVIVADERRIEQIMTNLLDNAIRFTPAGGQALISTSRDDDDVLIEVQNDGEPIPQDELPYLFDRFHQVDEARSDHHAGLGLAIVRELVQAHGGHVRAESSEETGTVFTVRLPANAPPSAGTAPEEDER